MSINFELLITLMDFINVCRCSQVGNAEVSERIANYGLFLQS